MTHPIIRFLLAGLNAKQSTRIPSASPKSERPVRTLYGWELGWVEDTSAVIATDGENGGKRFRAVKNWTHKPGDIIRDSNGGKHQKSYMVREDRSLRLIA